MKTKFSTVYKQYKKGGGGKGVEGAQFYGQGDKFVFKSSTAFQENRLCKVCNEIGKGRTRWG